MWPPSDPAGETHEAAPVTINDARASKERKAFKVSIGLSLTVIFCYLPQTIFWKIFMDDPDKYNAQADLATTFLWGLTTVIDPIVYELLNDDFRRLIFRSSKSPNNIGART